MSSAEEQIVELKKRYENEKAAWKAAGKTGRYDESSDAQAVRDTANKLRSSGNVDQARYGMNVSTSQAIANLAEDEPRQRSSRGTPARGNNPPVSRSALRGGKTLADMYGGITYDEQAILDKFNAGTDAEFAMKARENDVAANKFYGQMYGAQNTALDTIKKSNAKAVATGASRGMQAANELSTMLGFQQGNTETATGLAQDRLAMADEMAAKKGQNAVNALQYANQTKFGLGNLDANLYASDTQFDVGKMNYYGQLTQAENALQGARDTAASNERIAGIQAGASRDVADIQAGATRYAAEQGRDSANGVNEAAIAQSKAQQEYYQMLAKQGNQTDYEKTRTYLDGEIQNYTKAKNAAGLVWATAERYYGGANKEGLEAAKKALMDQGVLDAKGAFPAGRSNTPIYQEPAGPPYGGPITNGPASFGPTTGLYNPNQPGAGAYSGGTNPIMTTGLYRPEEELKGRFEGSQAKSKINTDALKKKYADKKTVTKKKP